MISLLSLRVALADALGLLGTATLALAGLLERRHETTAAVVREMEER